MKFPNIGPMATYGGKTILNRHFFVPDYLLGKTVVARVEVVEKTTDDGRKFLLVNFYPEDRPPKREVRFIQISDPRPEDMTHFFPVNENGKYGKCGIYFHPCRD